MLRKDFAASSLKILCENFNPIKSYGKTNMSVFVLSLWEKTQVGLNFFWPVYIATKIETSFLIDGTKMTHGILSPQNFVPMTECENKQLQK